ncbi:MAG: metal ABC transporter substrate-binding protein [Candidatus Dojkabacteria bacterium]
MNNKYLIFAGVIALLATLVGAGLLVASEFATNNEETSDLKLAASIFPVGDIAENIAGRNAEVVTILPAGASPHTYEPSASEQAELSDADSLFLIGLDFDNWAKESAESANSDIRMVDLSESVDLMEYSDGHRHNHNDEHDHHEEDHHHKDDHHQEEDHEDGTHSDEEHKEGEYKEEGAHNEGGEHSHSHEGDDPHYWLSVSNAKLIAEAVKNELVALDEANKDDYVQNYENYVAELEELEQEVAGRFADSERNEIITFHGAFNYMAEEQGLEVVAVVEEFPGQSPSASYIQEVGEVIEDYEIRTLFKEPQLSEEIVSALASDFDARVETLDPVGGVEGRNSYLELIRYNSEIIAGTIQ